MEKSVYLVWHLGSVIYVGSTMNLLERRAGHITQAYGTAKVAGLVDYMREVFRSGGRIKKFEFAFQELYRGEDWEAVEERTIKEMEEKFPGKLVNRSTIAIGNNSTHYKRIPPKVTREQIEKSIHTRRTTDCMKTDKVRESARNAFTKRMIKVIVDGVEYESAKAAAAFLNTSHQTVLRTANGTNTAFFGRISFKEKNL
jgi:hypothetical protein